MTEDWELEPNDEEPTVDTLHPISISSTVVFEIR
jgi:hypothetical protein